MALKQYYIRDVIEAGCDEAGRGPLAGSVFAAAVILPKDCQDERFLSLCDALNDSKQLTEHQRYALRPLIEEFCTWAVGEVTAEEIDRINILNAAILAMHRALDRLGTEPQHIIVDGNKWKPYVPSGIMEIPAQTIVKGDGKYMSIAAASILAKTYRDDYMLELHRQYPQYGWDQNKGYPTRAHYEAIAQYGITPVHRKTFRLTTTPTKTKKQ